MPRPRRVGGADRVDPQLLAKFASKIRVSTHGWKLAKAGGGRLRSCRGWTATSTGGGSGAGRSSPGRWPACLVAAVALVAIFGGAEGGQSTDDGRPFQLFSSEMTSEQYEAIHKGESESTVLLRLGSVGLQEDQVESSELPSLFPAAAAPHRPAATGP